MRVQRLVLFLFVAQALNGIGKGGPDRVPAYGRSCDQERKQGGQGEHPNTYIDTVCELIQPVPGRDQRDQAGEERLGHN